MGDLGTVEAASAFLATLDDDERMRATYPLDDAERLDWHYIPRPRNGLALADMVHRSRQAALRLVAAGMSSPGMAKVTAIMALDDVLREIEGGSPWRSSDLYSVTVFGTPGADQWGWRFEGHHVSLNFTLAGDDVAATPLFLGANPSRVEHATAPLAVEEELGRALAVAVGGPCLLDGAVPEDILFKPGEDAPSAAGVRGAYLSAEAADLLEQLIAVHLSRVRRPPAVDAGEVHFAWAGSFEPGRPHYYRLVGPRLVIEYDNTQDNANHIHTVWRDPENDFGTDLLRDHLRHEH